MAILDITMIVNSCQRKTSRSIVNGILSLFVAITYGIGIVFMILVGGFNFMTVIYFTFYIYLTLFNYKAKGCTVGDN